jgi:hypothetical protein
MVKRYNDLIILLIIWIVSIYSVISVITNSYEIGFQNYIGYGLLIGITILRFFRIKRFRTILGILLIVGSTNLIQFTYSTYTIVVKKFFSSVGIQPLSTLLLILLISFNYSDFLKLKAFLFAEEPNVSDDRKKQIALKYYDELKNEKNIKLLDIIDNKNMYQAAYVKAAQELIEERNINKTATK